MNRRGILESFFKIGFGQWGREGVLAVAISEGRAPGGTASVLGSLVLVEPGGPPCPRENHEVQRSWSAHGRPPAQVQALDPSLTPYSRLSS